MMKLLFIVVCILAIRKIICINTILQKEDLNWAPLACQGYFFIQAHYKIIELIFIYFVECNFYRDK